VAKRKILVTGGAGYIGSHTVRLLLDQGYDVSVVDDLSKGFKHNVPPGRLNRLNLCETNALAELMRQHAPEAVVHFAAYIAVGESMLDPGRYFHNNVCGSLSLLNAMVRSRVKHIVFSSTAAVYGEPKATPILEDFPIQPVSPYGESKVMVETLLGWFDRIHQVTSVRLRYFNACGADPEGRLGEEHDPERTSSRCCCAPSRRASRSPFSSTITLPPTAPAFAITSMSTTWRRRTSWRSNTSCPAANRKPSTSARARATR
jgi:UDP-glucose 4-epimerase